MAKSATTPRSNRPLSSEIGLLLEVASREQRLTPLLNTAIELFPGHPPLRELLGAVSPPSTALEYFTPSRWLIAYKAVIASRSFVCKIERRLPRTETVATGVVYDSAILTSAQVIPNVNVELDARFPVDSAISGADNSRGSELQTVPYPIVSNQVFNIGERTAFALLRISSSGDNPTRRNGLTPVETDPEVGDVLLIFQEPLQLSLGISVGSVTATQPDHILLSVRSESMSVGSPCFTTDGRFAAIVVAQSANTAVAIPAPRINDELNRRRSDGTMIGETGPNRQTAGGRPVAHRRGIPSKRSSRDSGNKVKKVTKKTTRKTTKKAAKRK